MSIITQISGTDEPRNSRAVINSNFTALETNIATGAEITTGTNDTKFTTAKGLKDSHNVPSITPGTVGNIIVSDGTDWTSASKYTLVATLSGDISTAADVNPVDLTGLVFTYASNSIYLIRFIGGVNSAAATTGVGFQLNTSSVITDIQMSFYHQLANTGTLSGGSSTADDVSLGVSSGIPTGGTTVPVIGHAILRTTSNTGTAQLRFRSETTAVTTAKAGLTMIVEKIA